MAAGKRRAQLEEWMANDLVPVFADRILPGTQAVADRWGTLSGHRQLAGRLLAMADGLIAATALEHGLTVVTRNVRYFETWAFTIFNPWMEAA